MSRGAEIRKHVQAWQASEVQPAFSHLIAGLIPHMQTGAVLQGNKDHVASHVLIVSIDSNSDLEIESKMLRT